MGEGFSGVENYGSVTPKTKLYPYTPSGRNLVSSVEVAPVVESDPWVGVGREAFQVRRGSRLGVYWSLHTHPDGVPDSVREGIVESLSICLRLYRGVGSVGSPSVVWSSET